MTAETRKPAFRFAAAGAMLLAFAPLPAAAQEVQAISAADKATGAKVHPQLVEEFGGAMKGPQAVYVERIGKDIAVQSGLSNARADFTVTLLNSSMNNAFAIPGGYVYVTRQLVGLMNNEAELAGVLGHEVGHVAAQHQKKRESTARKNAVIGVLGSAVLGAVLGNNPFGQLGQQVVSKGSELLTLKYSRGQETEADNLGIDYLRRAGYDPRAMSSVLESLARQSALEAKVRGSSKTVPEWASTHPADEKRVAAARARAGNPVRGTTNRDRFLAGIDGITWGDDPKEGVIEGRNFKHPDMRFGFDAPAGFYLVNGTRAVTIGGQSAKGELTSRAFDGDLEDYVGSVFAELGEEGATVKPGDIRRLTVNGLPAAYGIARSGSGSGALDIVVFAYEFSDKQAFHFLTISQAGGASVFNSMYGSMRRLDDKDVAGIKARRVSVVTVRKGDTLESLAARMAYADYQLERFLVLNGLNSSSRLTEGQKVKLVVY